jgi:hypothetical protein
MNMKEHADLIASTIRTIVPMVVALVAGAGARRLGLDATYLEELLFAGYFVGVRLLEERWPAAGWALGLAARPHYTA